MKTAITIIAIVGFLSYLFLTSNKEVDKPNATTIIRVAKPSINVVALQDCSASTTRNGVELEPSSVFVPYYEEVDRNITLSFGIISDHSAQKLITVELPAVRFVRPIPPDFKKISFVRKNAAKQKYTDELTQFVADSTLFYSDRAKRFKDFCNKVDSAVAPYRNNKSCLTDLETAIKIADRALNYSFDEHSQNYLLINSDGLDSYERMVRPLNSKAEVVLINANGISDTFLDSIVTRRFQSTEQAIDFTLKNHKN